MNVNPIKRLNSYDSFKDVIDRTLHLSIWGNVSKNIDKLNHYIEPKQLENYSLFDHNKIEEIFEIGYEYTTRYLNENQLDFS